MIDQPLTRYHFCNKMAIYFYTFVPQMKDHLSYKTIFCSPMGGHLSQVSLYTEFKLEHFLIN